MNTSAPAPPELDVYFSVESIWTCIGFRAFRSLVDKHALKLRLHPVPLLPLFAATGGVPLRARAPGRQRYRDFEVQRWCARRSITLDLGSRHLPPAASLVDRMVMACEAMELPALDLIDRALKAAWCERQDVGDESLCQALADSVGLPGNELVRRANDASVQARYQANLQDAVSQDVFGAPTFVWGGEVFWGQDRIEMLDDALTSGRAPYGPLRRL